MKSLLTVLFSLATISLVAQTKEIAFKSHSGNMEYFRQVLENDFFDVNDANFGLPSHTTLYKLDTVIYVSDSVTIVKQRVYRRYSSSPNEDQLSETRRDTLYHYNLFANKHALDSIKKIMRNSNNYKEPGETVFIGFDNKRPKEKKSAQSTNPQKETPKEQLTPAVITLHDDNNNDSPYGSTTLLIIGAILLLSLSGGWVSWKYYQPRLQKA